MLRDLPAAILRRGDKYSLKIQVKLGNEIITPENCSDIRIKIGNTVLSYSRQELTFEEGYWLFPLSQAMTLNHSGDRMLAQAQFKMGDNIYSTKLYYFAVENSLFKDTWIE